MQEGGNSSALAMELRLSCTNPTIRGQLALLDECFSVMAGSDIWTVGCVRWLFFSYGTKALTRHYVMSMCIRDDNESVECYVVYNECDLIMSWACALGMIMHQWSVMLSIMSACIQATCLPPIMTIINQGPVSLMLLHAQFKFSGNNYCDHNKPGTGLTNAS